MKKESEYPAKHRILRIMQALLDHPFGYTKKQLADIYDVHEDTIKNDFRDLKNAGFLVERDEKYRYRFVQNKPYKQLKNLLHFSEEDQALLYQAIDQIAAHSKSGEKLKQKLASLYDFRRLGHAYLRRPYLTKVDLIIQAKEEKKQVVLHDYRSSNSNVIEDRHVEPFHISPPEDTLQAFDIQKKELRHFRISRFHRVELKEENWQFEGHHYVMRTDPFRIVDDNQVSVHIRLKIGAYNELIERFPQTKGSIVESEEIDVYDFQCMVNHKFLGLTNFILGFHHQLVEIVHPESLKEHLRKEVQKINTLSF
ncbi:MAG: WYL domain-containing protein [Saprospiraceae bacterium]